MIVIASFQLLEDNAAIVFSANTRFIIVISGLENENKY